MIQDMVHDLAALDIRDLERAIEVYRKTAFPLGKFKPFPDSGTLIKLAAAECRHRTEIEEARPVRTQFGDSRPIRWWSQSRKLWRSHWRESEVPAGEMVRDQKTNKWRAPI